MGIHECPGSRRPLTGEQAGGVRVVAETESFIAFVPYAPRFADELHVLARSHACSLNDITDPERRSLAELLALVVPAYEGLRDGGAPYAMGIHQGRPTKADDSRSATFRSSSRLRSG